MRLRKKELKKMVKDKKLVSIIVPTKNEEQNIASLIKNIRKHCSAFLKEIIVVDGHSQDKTREIARKLGVKVVLDYGKGKGDAIREAIKFVKGEVTVFIDADGSHDPKDIKRLIGPILENKADHVSGSRILGGSDEFGGDLNEALRQIGNSIITLGINYRFNVKLTESQNGFRAVKTDVIRKLNLQENITTIEQEMIIKTLKNGHRLLEVPTHEYKRKYGDSSVVLRKVWFRYLYSWLKYLFLK